MWKPSKETSFIICVCVILIALGGGIYFLYFDVLQPTEPDRFEPDHPIEEEPYITSVWKEAILPHGKYFQCDVNMIIFNNSGIHNSPKFFEEIRYGCAFETALTKNPTYKYCLYVNGLSQKEEIQNFFVNFTNFAVLEFDFDALFQGVTVQRLYQSESYMKSGDLWGVDLYNLVANAILERNEGGIVANADTMFLKELTPFFKSGKDFVLQEEEPSGGLFCANQVFLCQGLERSKFYLGLKHAILDLTKNEIEEKRERREIERYGSQLWDTVCQNYEVMNERRYIYFLSALQSGTLYSSTCLQEKDLEKISNSYSCDGRDAKRLLSKIWWNSIFYQIHPDGWKDFKYVYDPQGASDGSFLEIFMQDYCPMTYGKVGKQWINSRKEMGVSKIVEEADIGNVD